MGNQGQEQLLVLFAVAAALAVVVLVFAAKLAPVFHSVQGLLR